MVLSLFFILAILINVQRSLLVLICISLRATDIECLPTGREPKTACVMDNISPKVNNNIALSMNSSSVWLNSSHCERFFILPPAQVERAVTTVEVTLCGFRLCHKSVMHFHPVFLGHSLSECSLHAARTATLEAMLQVSGCQLPLHTHLSANTHYLTHDWGRCHAAPSDHRSEQRWLGEPNQLSDQRENAKMTFASRCAMLGWLVIMTIYEQKCLLYKTPRSNRLVQTVLLDFS